MKTQLKLNVITEQDLSLTAKLLLILNRKQIKLNAMNIDSDYSAGFYNYQLQVSGNSNMLQQARKVIAKQIGVLHVEENIANLYPRKKMALV